MQLISLIFIYWFASTPIAAIFPADQIITGTNRIALSISGGEESIPTTEQLQLARSIGITLLEVDHPTHIREIRVPGFYFLLNSPFWYYTPHQLEDTDKLIHEIEFHYRSSAALNGNSIAAISLFNYPDDRSGRFHRGLTVISDSLSSLIGKPFYYRSAHSNIPPIPDGLSFIVSTVYVSQVPDTLHSPVIQFRPSHNTPESVASLQTVLNRLLEFENSIIILPADWFFERLSAQPDIAIIFSAHTRGEEIILPLPDDDDGMPDPNLSVILLFLIFAAFVIHYRYQPTYPFFIVRYFFNHPFFVADIMENRLRNLIPGIIMLLKHSALNGLFFCCLGIYFISETGWKWLTDFYPAIFFQPIPEFTLFIAGTLLAILVHFLSLVWIFLLNKSLKSPGQVIHLYSWPLSLNLVFVSLLVLLVQIDAAIVWVLLLSSLSVIVWFTSYNVAAIDSARFLYKYIALNIFLTVGVHFLFIVSLILFLFFTPSIFEPLYWLIMIP
ncbi:MAG: hypothetical protein EA359_06015 [Balneolaceae bacterium]|nr:MAG: hypothetical protein EA359_06015 [Balneolaceae bacterium]